jgi:hypothetical protein
MSPALITMSVGDYFGQGRRGWVRLHEKSGKKHEAPCVPKLEHFLDECIAATGITDYLKSDGSLAEARKMANHADTPTTQLYDRCGDIARSRSTARWGSEKCD